MLDFGPGGILPTGFHNGLDEGHPSHPILDFWVIGDDGSGGFSVDGATDVGGEVFVDVCEGLEVALGMSGRGSSGREGRGPEVTVSGSVDFHGFVHPFNEEGVGLLLMPFEAAFFSVDANVEVVFFADADLRAMENAFRAVFQTDEDVRVVVELTAFDEGGEVSCEFLNFQAGDVFCEIFGMGADVADAACCAGAGGVGSPRGLLLS